MARLADVIGEIGDLVSSARDKFHMRTASSFEPRLADMATTIALDRPVHFLAADDSEVELDAGLYGVTARGNGYLTLTSLEHGRTSVIRAQETFHELLPNSPLALTVPDEDDELHVVLLLPGGGAIQGTGSYGRIRSHTPATRTIPTSALGEVIVKWIPPGITAELPLNKAILLSPDRLVWGKIEPGPTPSGFSQQSTPPNWVSATVATCYVAPAGSAGPAGPGTETGIPPFPPGSAVRRVPTPAYLVSVTPVTVQSSLLGAGRMVQLLATNYVVTLGGGSLLSMTWTDVYQMVAPTSGPVTFPGVIVATGRVPLSPPPVNSTWEAEVAKRLTGAPGAGAPLDLELRVEGITVATRSMRFNAQFPGSPAVF